MNNIMKCQSQGCQRNEEVATFLHKDKFELRCAMCLDSHQRTPYYNIKEVTKVCKKQLINTQEILTKNKSELKPLISKHFQSIILNIQGIQNKINQNIDQFLLSNQILVFCQNQQNDIQLLYDIIQNYFQPDNEKVIIFKENFKNYIGMPVKIEKKLIDFNNILRQFLQNIQDNSNYESGNQQQDIQSSKQSVAPESQYMTQPKLQQQYNPINIMNQYNTEPKKNKIFEFTLLSKKTFQLKGLQFEEQSANAEYNILIEDDHDKDIYQKKRIIGSRNYSAIFENTIEIQEYKKYKISIYKNNEFDLLVYKQKIPNDYVEVIDVDIPIVALLIIEQN